MKFSRRAMPEKRKILCATLFLVAMAHCATFQARMLNSSDRSQGTPRGSTISTTLADVTSLAKWVSDITPTLQQQGNEADRNKLRGKLKSINDQLASTETINLAVVKNLKSTNPDYGKLREQLNRLHDADNSIAASIAAIRSQLHLNGQEQTDLERHASDAVSAKGIEVDKMLEKLEYSIPQTDKERQALQDRSEELVKLIRQAEDAIGNAYRALQSPN